MNENLKNVLLKRVIPLAVDGITDYIENRKEEKDPDITIQAPIELPEAQIVKGDNDGDEYAKLAVGMIRYVPVEEINKVMDAKNFTPEQKIENAYCNGFVQGFIIADTANQIKNEMLLDRIGSAMNLDKTTTEIANDLIENINKHK
jgi:hypothetical protein